MELDLRIEQAGHEFELTGSHGNLTARFRRLSSVWHFAKLVWRTRWPRMAGTGLRIEYGRWGFWLRPKQGS